jgi:hypothetical protein
MSEEIAYAESYARLQAENARLRTTLEGARALLRKIDAANPGSYAVGAVLLACEKVLDERGEVENG